MNEKNTKYLLGGAFVIVLVIAGALVISYKQRAAQPKVTPQVVPTTKPIAPPTLTPERIEIIKKMETLEVSIKSSGFDPAELRVKLHDQVTWTNNDSKNHKVAGSDWGKVTIGPGERYTKAFEKAGTFEYSCGLQPELKGKIIVE